MLPYHAFLGLDFACVFVYGIHHTIRRVKHKEIKVLVNTECRLSQKKPKAYSKHGHQTEFLLIYFWFRFRNSQTSWICFHIYFLCLNGIIENIWEVMIWRRELSYIMNINEHKWMIVSWRFYVGYGTIESALTVTNDTLSRSVENVITWNDYYGVYVSGNFDLIDVN